MAALLVGNTSYSKRRRSRHAPTLRPDENKQDNEQAVIATEAGIEKGLSDEITKGLKYAAKSLRVFNERERLTLLI
jgi:hypothetical protein